MLIRKIASITGSVCLTHQQAQSSGMPLLLACYQKAPAICLYTIGRLVWMAR
jgi:hypothetical protein